MSGLWSEMCHCAVLWLFMLGLWSKTIISTVLSYYFHCDVRSVCLQVVLTVSQIMWCRDLTECLTTEDGDVLEAVQQAEQRCFQVGLGCLNLLLPPRTHEISSIIVATNFSDFSEKPHTR